MRRGEVWSENLLQSKDSARGVTTSQHDSSPIDARAGLF